MAARNIVVNGDYKNKKVIRAGKKAAIPTFWGKVYLDTKNIASFEVMSEVQHKSASSGIAKGLIGGFFLGPIGALAGATSGDTVGTYKIVINFRNGKRSLLEIDDTIYGLIMDNITLDMRIEPTAAMPPQNSAEAVNNNSMAAQMAQPNFSVADEILKFKQLADSGIITQQEFEKKKQQLLNT